MMTTINQMLDTHPLDPPVDDSLLAACLQACLECAQACTTCADACLAEEMVAELRTCIRLNLDCADLCATTARVLGRRAGFDTTLVRALLLACAAACRSCGEECSGHAEMHEHCRVCAEACRRCEQTCEELLAGLG